MSSATLPALKQGGTSLDVRIDQDAVLKAVGLNLRDPNSQALLLTCQRYNLDPVLKHMVLIQGRPYVTRDGLLHVAHASGQLDGIEVLEQGENQTHFTAKVAVHRKDMGRPFTYIGRYPKNGGNKAYGPEMAVKCGEVMAMRRAFDVALCAREELWDQDAAADYYGEPVEAPTPAASTPPKDSRPFGDFVSDGCGHIAAEFKGAHPDSTRQLPGPHQVARHCYRLAAEAGFFTAAPTAKQSEVLKTLAGCYGSKEGRKWLRTEVTAYLRAKLEEANEAEREADELAAAALGEEDEAGDVAASLEGDDFEPGSDG